MKFKRLSDETKLGIVDTVYNGKTFYMASYEGAVITKLFGTELEAADAALNMMKRIIKSPILGVIAFDLDMKIRHHDRICFWQVVQAGREQVLVVGTQAGALVDLYYAPHIVDEFEFDMTISEVLGLCARQKDVGIAG